MSFNLRATCPSCSTALFGNDVLVRNVEVPVLREVDIVAEENTFSGAANGIPKALYLNLYNLGNDDEQYDLTIGQSNWRLQAPCLQTSPLFWTLGMVNPPSSCNCPCPSASARATIL